MKNCCVCLFTSLLIFLPVFFSQCHPLTSTDELLLRAERFADSGEVDSGLRYIDSIVFPERSLRKEFYMQYVVTDVRLRYNGFRDIRNDSSIFQALRYFKHKASEPRWTALAAFYGGCVWREQKNKNKAMSLYHEAFTEAQKTKDYNLKALIVTGIGDLFWEEELYREALTAYRKAEKFSPPPSPNRAKIMSKIGGAYLMLQQQDSALTTFEEGLSLALKNKDVSAQMILMQNISIVYQQQQNYAEAFKYLRQSFHLNTEEKELPRYYLNFGNLYAYMGFADSARFFYHKVEEKLPFLPDDEIKLNIYESLAEMANARGDFKKQAEIKARELNLLMAMVEKRNNNSLLDVQRKYNFELLKNRQQQETTRYQQEIIALLVAVIAGGGIFFWYTLRQRKKMLEVKDYIAALQKMAYELDHSHQSKMEIKERSLRELVLWRFDVVRKLALLLNENMEKLNGAHLLSEFRKIVYSKNEPDVWTNIAESIEMMEPGLFSRLGRLSPKLTETEQRIALLTYAGMNLKEISVIMGITQRSVQSNRTLLRKKIGVEDPREDTMTLLHNLLRRP